MPSVNLRQFPAELLRKIKSQAALDGITLRAWIIDAVEQKLKPGRKK
jgi:hypothetical protein